MANSYASNKFKIDTSTNRAGLVALKGGAPAVTDDLYLYNNATCVLSADIDIMDVFVGRDDGGLSSAGHLDLLPGASIKFKTGSGKGLYIDALGIVSVQGTSGSRCGLTRASGETEYWEILQMDGQFTATECKIDYVEVIASLAGNWNLTGCSMVCLFSATNQIVCSGSMVLVSSVITSYGNRWSLLNYGYVSMDLFSYLGQAKISIVCSSQALVFDDDPDAIGEANEPIIARNNPLGGGKSRGKRLGVSGRRLLLAGTFNISRYESHYLLMKYLLSLNDTFAVTWDEGSINKALLTKFPISRTPDQIQERAYSLELQEVY